MGGSVSGDGTGSSLEASEGANVERPPQLGGGAGVGGEERGRGGGVRRRRSRRGVAVEREDAGDGHVDDSLTQLRVELPE